MTTGGKVIAAALALVFAGAGTLAAGFRGAAVILVSVVAVEGIVLLAIRYPTPARRQEFPTRRAIVPVPARARPERQLSAIQMATRGPRWADVELRPYLRTIVDSLGETGGARPGHPAIDTATNELGDNLAWFVDPGRHVRGHDEGVGLTLAEVEDMIRRIEGLV